MTITYHKEISTKGNEVLFPHEGLNKSIRLYIEQLGYQQAEYSISYNGYYLFIYLLNGDRIDVNI